MMMTLCNGQHQGQVQVAPIISNFYCDATNLLQAEHCVKITNNWMTWWSLNQVVLLR